MRCWRAWCSVLVELQRAFASELFAGGARLRTHRETVLSGLAGALEAIHPVCLRLVGSDFFRALARRFAREVPSRSPDLNDYGAALGDFLERFEPARALVYLPDVARLEWALHRARHAPDAVPLDVAALAALPEQERAEFRFQLAPGTGLVASRWPVDRIWQANQPESGADGTLCLDSGEVQLVISRGPQGTWFERVSAAELALLRGFARGEPLERAAAEWPESAESLGRALARAAELGWIA
ncbi:MAG: putative DNA-binding domain-containing protein [Myxococcota bacterium]